QAHDLRMGRGHRLKFGAVVVKKAAVRSADPHRTRSILDHGRGNRPGMLHGNGAEFLEFAVAIGFDQLAARANPDAARPAGRQLDAAGFAEAMEELESAILKYPQPVVLREPDRSVAV